LKSKVGYKFLKVDEQVLKEGIKRTQFFGFISAELNAGRLHNLNFLQ
jgi:hypothetical protein